MSEMPRLIVLASGYGSNLQAIIDGISSGYLAAHLAAVVSDKENSYALPRASNNGIPGILHNWRDYQERGITRQEYDADLARIVQEFDPQLIILAGWMRLLSMAFLSVFPMKVINLHPALPGMFPGTKAIRKAFQAFQAGQIQETGVMVHYVPDEGVDDGPIIAYQNVPIYLHDTLEKLEERIHLVEHQLLVESINRCLGDLSQP